jgi:DNA-binding MarR family transcriptional regulator/GNAT superfamily N-acetyltransferase
MSKKPALSPDETIAAVRGFSRFYTRQLGLLDEGLLQSSFQLTEARILYELAYGNALTATQLCRDLGLDAGYLSRILKSFEARGLITRSAALHDGRQSVIGLTNAGRAAFAPLDQASQQQVLAMIGRMTPEQLAELIKAMQTVEHLIRGETPKRTPCIPRTPYILRPPRLGDIGWIIHRQAVLYNLEYDWDQEFEVLLAEIFAEMMKTFDPRHDGGWIVEQDGDIMGSVFVVRVSDAVAKLRLLYLEPAMRGLGLGQLLVEECIRFAKEKGYRSLTLWTNDVLVPARRIYQQAGFRRVAAEPQRAFGQDLVSETWELAL